MKSDFELSKKRLSGFTLVELIIAMVLVGIIILTLVGFLSNGLTYHAYNSREFTVQTDVKYVTTHVAKTIKNATVTFIVTADDYKGTAEGLTPGWNYIGQNAEGTQLLEFTYNKQKKEHEVRLLTQGAPGMKYLITFDKDNEVDDKLIDFDVKGWLNETSALSVDHNYRLSSRVSAEKANMVYSRAKPTKPGVALAYRSDPIPKGMQINLTLVLDNSGSMAWDMSGRENKPEKQRRITILKEETTKLIDDFVSIGFVNIVLSPFGSTARQTSNLLNVVSDRKAIDKAIKDMYAEGGTNVGDGMRVGFHKVFSSDKRDPLLEQRDYVIILTDGAANAYFSNYPTDNGRYTNWKGGYDDPRSNIDRALTYIQIVYNYFQNRLDKVYVIGFSAVSKEKELGNDIGRLTGGRGYPRANNYYDASSSEDLRSIYEEIRGEITRELWYVMGP